MPLGNLAGTKRNAPTESEAADQSSVSAGGSQSKLARTVRKKQSLSFPIELDDHDAD